MIKKYKIFLIILILAAAAGAFWYLKYNKGGETKKNVEEMENYPFTNPDLKARYNDPDLGFFVDYPEGFTVNDTGEENVKVLVFSKKDSPASEAGESFQIFIMPYDEPGPITPERILIDQPDIVMKDPQTIQIAGEEALVFFSTDPDIGDIREVWFVHPSTMLGASGHLYQASTYAKYDELLSKVMATFRLN
ncbi:hypothetical protein A3I27_02205 [Candidatus Giovannonibacteria bacterium RIFCSPLOWO2_02_FULL_43_11b]|uniref:PsbP C-terminal domain-containing protein n=1 Tax=Candidatus Giovannonibacteria bacterium RIFCSPHIGHO2_12_FULL_43_15 TaxID=1798341 RepID=A0A1F5WQ64_9BACT|nr:MAG: hypothetical protein A2739_02590 [Candidatus Giovannonibacteria bacterium RIFCSPHIGHO2_01_FULL_43_100]OGF67308.1 MAG: hypothetical protein A3B97_03300 [Candidatus Giovannonibacteria bacterium RIFCSPHIGHO2_02_FULL_43_32]OGF77796.1 MAG: hypothetical protein A3F23_04175 [Candidatus Giovannonibacteria bacterium RIFCSPHIGHO2_12_FULL_43_15]OGF78589.1 MAG: hypothetical protein A3A15_01360 [Candidatus Giovannonibacteria bacterium RIFCSPLOWO2_01_FULL_43_60]OGF90026.1 MAG: hypothetical protein A3